MSDLDRAIIANVVRECAEVQGECEYCGCKGDTCKGDDGELCHWMNKSRTICSGKACVIAASRAGRLKRIFASRRRTKGRAA